MKYIGAHVPTVGGVQTAPQRAHDMGATGFALFTTNQRTWRTRPLPAASIAAFRDTCHDLGYGPETILPHDSYLINLGAPDPLILEKSREAFLEEIRRCEALGLCSINFHPGSHKGQMTDEQCLLQVAAEVNRALERTSGVTAVIETTAGQGSNVGYLFEHLATVIEHVEDKTRIGFCIDTCHIFAAGYDISTPERYESLVQEIDRVVGLRYLRGVHLNDSKMPWGSRKDRHEVLGEGEMGWQPFELFVRDPRLSGVPFILETPQQERWPQDIARLRELCRC